MQYKKEDDIQIQPKAKQNLEKLKSLEEQFRSALKDYAKNYVNTNMNPESSEYEKIYRQSSGQLMRLNKEIFILTNDIEKEIERVDLQLYKLNKQLTDEKGVDKELTDIYGHLKGVDAGAETMYHDSRHIYTRLYLRNVALFVGILLVLGVSFSVFKPPAMNKYTGNLKLMQQPQPIRYY